MRVGALALVVSVVGLPLVEFTYREDGALFTNQVVMTTGSQAPPCDD
jgi:hypothetical protein